MAKFQKFYNFTDKKFAAKWDGEFFDVPAGGTLMVESGIAESFAKQLADREMNRKKIDWREVHKHKAMKKKALMGQPTEDMSETKATIERAEEIQKHEQELSERDKIKERLDEIGVEYDGRRSTDHLKALLKDVEEDGLEEPEFEGIDE